MPAGQIGPDAVMLMLGQKKPAEQGAKAERPIDGQTPPAGQDMGKLMPAGQYVPAGQIGPDAVMLTLGQKKPAEQGVTADRPVDGQKLPAGQDVGSPKD